MANYVRKVILKDCKKIEIKLPLLNLMYTINLFQVAGWQSGYAAACKAVNSGSIPDSASIYNIHTYKDNNES